jgi:hypothetical protein
LCTYPHGLTSGPASRRAGATRLLADTAGVHPRICYRRIAGRGGAKKAIVALGRSILVIIWHLLSDPNARFHDLGSDFYANHTNRERKVRNHISQLNALGYRVNLDPAA